MNKTMIIKLCPVCKIELNEENHILTFAICDKCHKNKKKMKLRKKCEKCNKFHDYENELNFMPFLSHLI
jgi:endogenous inhibitor of DNA gyrase (YacG/DUF329 family)